ncbi:hypothetical protein [Kineosporia babensis]|uniref:WXG100 family type VII secretion target n=1 Tax=Kineosporia babensis TaxID=499548 RepID=A0A9X1NKJ6_9ACTN|nr:hypothetical protein [Kineosporia babensis]MCD5315479.1 hypothetical protein [Kineosporia babensis]
MDEANRIADAIERVDEDLAKTKTQQWTGVAADAAGTEKQALTGQLESRLQTVTDLRKALSGAATAMTGVERAVGDAESYAESRGLRIAGNGSVTDELEPPLLDSPAAAKEYTLERDLMVKEAARLVEEALNKAVQLDVDLSEGLAAAITQVAPFLPAYTLAKAAASYTPKTLALTRGALVPTSAMPKYLEYQRTWSALQALQNQNPGDLMSRLQHIDLEGQTLSLARSGAHLPLAQQQHLLDASRGHFLYKSIRSYQGDAGAIKTVQNMYPALSEADVLGKVTILDKLGRPARLAAPFVSKVMGPVGIATGLADVRSAVTDETASTTDRTVKGVGGVAGTAAGAAVTALAFGATATVGAPVLAVAAVGGGIVATGAYAYEHREQIGDVLGAGWDTAGRATDAVGDAVGKTPEAAGELRDRAVGAIGNVAGKAADATLNAAGGVQRFIPRPFIPW